MRKTLSGLLVLVLALSFIFVFTGCGDDGNQESEGFVSPLTITITTIGDATTEAVAKVQTELNKITEGKFNTHVILNVVKESEYEERLNEMITANDEGLVNIGGSDVIIGATTETAVVTKVNELTGRVETVYPTADKNQLDIFLVPEGWAKYNEYAENVLLSDLSTFLTDSNGKLLNQYIPSAVLNSCMIDGALYGVPSNVPYGDCEFLFINKELYDNYNYSMDEVDEIYDIQNFLVDVAKDVKSGKLADVVPLYNISDMTLLSLTGRKSVVAQAVSNTASVTDGSFIPLNILTIPAVQNMAKLVNEINSACGIMPVTDESADLSANFAAGFVRGGLGLVEEYSDEYYIINTRVAVADAEDLYRGIYGVSTYAEAYADRCMQLITCLNTNAEFRNILAYGVKNEHYIVSEDTGIVSRASDDYIMDIYRTGNVFLLMQNDQMTAEELSLSANGWKNAIEANGKAIVSPYAQCVIDFSESKANSTANYKVLSEVVPELERLYDEIWVWISEYPEAVNSEGEQPAFATYIQDLQKKLNADVYVKSATSTTQETSLRKQYGTWYELNYPS